MTTSKVCDHCGSLIEQHDWYVHQLVHIPQIAQHHQDWCVDPNCVWKETSMEWLKRKRGKGIKGIHPDLVVMDEMDDTSLDRMDGLEGSQERHPSKRGTWYDSHHYDQ